MTRKCRAVAPTVQTFCFPVEVATNLWRTRQPRRAIRLLFCFKFFKAPESPQFPPERPLEAPQLGRKPELGKAH